MKHFLVTLFAGLVFLATAFLGGALPVFSDNVSPETSTSERFRETFAVKQGVSQDGLLTITKIPDAPGVPPQLKPANHERTLRAFLAPNRGGVPGLYLESVKPHEYYSLVGGFVVSSAYPVLAWDSGTVLTFYGTSPDGRLMEYRADVHAGSLSSRSIDRASIPTESSPSGDIVP